MSEPINQHGGSLFRQITDQTVADVVDSAATRLDYPVDGDRSVWSVGHQEVKREAPTFGGPGRHG